MGEATMQDVMERFLPTIADRSFSREQLNAIRCIRNCRTAEMGAHVSECESCHPHLHVIVLGGGLDRMNHWKDKGRRFFLPVKVMSAVFKKHYLAELKELRKNGDLNYAGKCETLRNGHAFKELLDRLYGMDWIAYSKKTFAGAREVFKYLGKYTHRIAISNRRIISVGEKDVTFYAKDYCADGKYKPFTLSGEAFLSRFLLHVLPSGFVKIRYYGLLACRCKTEKVALCRKLLGCREYQSELRGRTAAEKIKILFGRDVSKCSRCGEKLNTFVVSGHYMLC